MRRVILTELWELPAAGQPAIWPQVSQLNITN
jgi:hypothetical protein